MMTDEELTCLTQVESVMLDDEGIGMYVICHNSPCNSSLSLINADRDSRKLRTMRQADYYFF